MELIRHGDVEEAAQLLSEAPGGPAGAKADDPVWQMQQVIERVELGGRASYIRLPEIFYQPAA